jgi:hypothetical protein
MVDMLPIWGFQSGEGKIPFLTSHNGLVLYDPFDTGAQPNANVLVTGTSGAGESFAVNDRRFDPRPARRRERPGTGDMRDKLRLSGGGGQHRLRVTPTRPAPPSPRRAR